MKKRGLIFVCFMAAAVLMIMIAAVRSDQEPGRERELEQIKKEADGQIRRNLEKAAKEGSFSRYLDPSEVSFAVKEAYREDVWRYAVKVVFTAKTDRKLNDAQMKEAAKDMEKLCKEFRTDQGKYVTAHSQRGKRGILSVINGKVVDTAEPDFYGDTKRRADREKEERRGEDGKKNGAGKAGQVKIKRKGCVRVFWRK